MSEVRELPNRGENSTKNLSPNSDRLSLMALVLVGLVSFPFLSEEIENIFPNYGDLLALFILILIIPIVSTKVGKMITRFRVN